MWDFRRTNSCDSFAARDKNEKRQGGISRDNFTVTNGSPAVRESLGLNNLYSKMGTFSNDGGSENHDEQLYSFWNRSVGKDVGIDTNADKQLSPTNTQGMGSGCHLFEDLVSKILDEDTSPHMVSEQRNFSNESVEVFTKHSRRLRSQDLEKSIWFDGRKVNLGQQNLLEAAKVFQATDRNGVSLPQTHSATDILNMNMIGHSWKQKSSSEHLIPDLKSDPVGIKGFDAVDGTSLPLSGTHSETKNLFSKSNFNMDESCNDSGVFVLGSTINSEAFAIPGLNITEKSKHISNLSVNGQGNEPKLCSVTNFTPNANPAIICDGSQKSDGSGWFVPMGLNNPDILNPVVLPRFTNGNRLDGSCRNHHFLTCVEQKCLWPSGDVQGDAVNIGLSQSREAKKVMDTLLSTNMQCPAGDFRPLLKRPVYQYDNEIKPDIMPIMGGPFVTRDYIHPEATIYSNPSVLSRFIPLALLNHGMRNNLSQVKMTPVFVKPNHEIGHVKTIPRKSTMSTMVDYHLEHCFEQLNNLEREEVKVENELCKLKILVGGNAASSNFPRFSHNSTRVNHLVAESLKQHAKINTMLMKIKKMSSHPLHANIYSAMDTWLEGIRKVQARRKEEIVSSANRNNSGSSRSQEDKDNLALSSAIEELLGQTRKVRTALWCAFQMCLFACSSPQEAKDVNYNSVQF